MTMSNLVVAAERRRRGVSNSNSDFNPLMIPAGMGREMGAKNNL